VWLAEFASAIAGAVVALVALVVLSVGLAGLAAGRIANRRRPPAS
jgi:hypothetical protein